MVTIFQLYTPVYWYVRIDTGVIVHIGSNLWTCKTAVTEVLQKLVVSVESSRFLFLAFFGSQTSCVV
jgi:hypothetical protein